MRFENYVLVYPMDTRGRVLMARKKRKWCEGKLVGFGGKIEPHETIRAAVKRELGEELNLQFYHVWCRLIAVLDISTGETPRRVFVLTGKPVEESQEFLRTTRLNTDEFVAGTLKFWDMDQVKPEDLPEGDDGWLQAALAGVMMTLHVQVFPGRKRGTLQIEREPSLDEWDIDEVPAV
jgi:8-oxo-dGTP pyrophosphatase MutT (NUDIX family)